jgi:phage tail-like protein
MPPKASRNDPYLRFNFLVEIDGIQAGFFKSVSGLDSETEVVEYRTGAMQGPSSLKLPGLHKFANITLKRGITQDLSLWQWYKTVLDGQTDRRNGVIMLLNESLQPVLRWQFRDGWICKWEGPDLDASANEVAIETIEIAHEGLELDSG